MGQRIQIIVKLPKYFINDGNPNNREEEYLVYHNQWLYGFFLLDHIRDIINNFKLIKEDWETGELNRFVPDYKEFLKKATLSANYKNPIRHRNTVPLFEKNSNDFIAIRGSWDVVLESLDNNNGFIFLVIDRNGNISYDLLSGKEDTEIIKRVTTEEYLSLFEGHKNKEIVEFFNKLKRIDYRKLVIPETKLKKYKVILKEKLFIYAETEEEAREKAEDELKKNSFYYLKITKTKK